MLLGLIWMAVVQTPSGYLGIWPGKEAVFTGVWFHDSYLGGSDSASVLDTMSVTDTFTYNGHEAFRILTVRHSSGDTIIDTTFTDSVWNDAPWLMARGRVSDTISRDVFHMRTPFTKGDSWSTGIEGTYRDNFDGYAGLDLMEIRSEIVTVEDSEVVSVPAGSFFTWRLRKETKGCITEPSNPILDSVLFERLLITWWSPGNCVVKDTTHTLATAFILGNPVADETWEQREMISITGIDEGRPSPGTVKLLSSNLAGSFLRLSRPPVGALEACLYDPSGRLVLSASSQGGSELSIDLGNLEPGVYFLRASLDSRPALSARIVRAR